MAKILIIDDMPGVRRSISAVLKQKGHDITEAENGRVGIDTLGKEDFDLVITDMLMPEEDGMTVINHLKDKTDRPSILAISGGGANVDPNYALNEAGKFVDKTLSKPFNKNQLIETVEELVG